MINNMLGDLLTRKKQRFLCHSVDDSNLTFIAEITHEVTSPLSDDELSQLRGEVDDLPTVINFYKKYGSLRLFCDAKSASSGFYIANPNEWSDLKKELQEWINDLTEDELIQFIPSWLDKYIVIGEVPDSGNYFILPLNGEEKGKVFEFEHDGFEFIEVGNDLNSFISIISNPTDELVENIAGRTRFSDGKTDIQWLAKSYEYE